METDNANTGRVQYDEIVKSLFHISGRLTVYAINALFHKEFDENAEIINGEGEIIKNNYKDIYTDLMLNVKTPTGYKKYHIEVQTAYDNEIIIRMIDYGFSSMIYGIDLAKINSLEKIELEMPSQIVIFLKERSGIPDEIKADIILPYAEKKVEYAVPVFKIWEHDLDYYKINKLYILYPFLILRIDKKIQAIRRRSIDDKEKERLINNCRNELISITKRIVKDLVEELGEGHIFVEELNKILINLYNLSAELYGNDIKDVDEEVKDVVKTFIDPALIEKGKEEGLKKGMDEGIKKGLDEGLKKGELKSKRDTVLKMIKKRYGILSKELEGKVNTSDIDTLDAVIDGILDNKTLGEIEDILR